MFLVEIAALFLALWALRRVKRVEDLEARVRALETQIRLLRADLRPAPSAGAVVVAEAQGGAHGASQTDLDEVAAPITDDAEVPRRVGDGPPYSGEAEPMEPRPRSLPPPLPPPLPPQRPAEPPSFAPQIDWERWLGVRGAAVLGGIVLALAGIFLFRYSIEHDLTPPWLRVVGGISTGLACIVAAERYLRREYAGTADAVEGGGVVILYASVWAARGLYGLIGTPSAFVLMMSITATCCALSWRHASLLVALLGLTGGFATPFLIDSGADNPFGLFAYVFLLDVALLYLAEKRGWPLLAFLSLAATTLYQAAWIFWRMGGRSGTGLVVLAVSGAIFAIASRFARDGEKVEWKATQAAGLLLPVLFALYFAGSVPLSPTLTPIALLIGTLAAGACWLAAVHRRSWLGLGAAAGTVAVIGIWMAGRTLHDGDLWELAAVAVALAGVFHVAVELDREQAGADGPAPAALVAVVGLYWVLVAGVAQHPWPSIWPWLAGWLGLTAILLRHAEFPSRAWLRPVAWGILGIGLANGYATTAPANGAALWLGLAVAAQLVALLRRDEPAHVWGNHAAALFAAIGLLNLPRLADSAFALAPLMWPVALALGVLMALASVRLGLGQWLLAAVALTAFSQWTFLTAVPFLATNAGLLFAIGGLSVVVFAAVPFLAGRRFAADAWAWPAAALAGPAWFWSLRQLFLLAFGDAAIGLLPVGLGAVAAVQGWQASQLWSDAPQARRNNLAWFFVVAIGFITLAIPLQLEKEWITIAWALEGIGVLLLWRRLDVPWLKYFALALLLSVTVRLVANPAVLGYYPRPSWRIVNWLLYSYLIPAAALLAGAQVLRQLEVGRARTWEAPLYARERPLGAVVLGFAGLVVVFVWINLAIADWFSTGPDLQVSLERLPARDLTMSICWALYALGLLAVGVRLRSVGVRWVSLGIMIVTIAKVFLYDLGELRDLYRVASLLGLAISLIAVSLAYQRFVLPRAVAAEER